ncbi:MAG: Lrp/AsnC family transcriptional regulator [Alphaproteobacteria bacterium]|jgi:DNA-binding Lrp family transcriptional regulator|nr:AsnC family transcriptional regulator [Rhodospirillaceae bacterium]MDP6404191.1 Lrp/AsnC family transcriptional regulator [Alphaproteobacteria bacterium]MDP6623400.1 Lrp/AsnC family transcriptional regulator [Alphaproteobacteria bacterium]|tara:strand:- start:404 stop:886 length:483 start_codon:yes stop_codon:yes gene_type:complete
MDRLDSQDCRILDELQRDGRLSIAELAERIGLSTTPCWRRVRRLQEEGVIRSYVARLDPQQLGIGLDVFVNVTIDMHRAQEFEGEIRQRDEVVEGYATTGERDYLLHIMVADIQAFEVFVQNDLIRMPGVDRVTTSLVLKTIKDGTAVPLRYARERAEQN